MRTDSWTRFLRICKKLKFPFTRSAVFRKQACEFPELAEKDRFQAIHQEIVKMKSIPDQSTDLYGQSSKEDIVQIKNPAAAMELQIGQAVLRISNQTDPRLLEQTLKLIEAFSFCGKSKKDDPAVFWLWNFLKIFFWYKEINFIAQK